MKLKTILLLSSTLLFAIGTANAGTPVNGSYYMIDLTPSGYCDAWEFYTYGPSSTAAGTFNGTSGIHDLNTFCDLGLSFAWGGFEVPFEKINPPNDSSESNANAYDVSGTDIEQYYEFGYTNAVTYVFDVTAGTKHRPNAFAVYEETGDGNVYVFFEGPIEIDAYTPGVAEQVKAAARPSGLPRLGDGGAKQTVRKLN
jgi:hypothetical protein